MAQGFVGVNAGLVPVIEPEVDSIAADHIPAGKLDIFQGGFDNFKRTGLLFFLFTGANRAGTVFAQMIGEIDAFVIVAPGHGDHLITDQIDIQGMQRFHAFLP